MQKTPKSHLIKVRVSDSIQAEIDVKYHPTIDAYEVGFMAWDARTRKGIGDNLGSYDNETDLRAALQRAYKMIERFKIKYESENKKGDSMACKKTTKKKTATKKKTTAKRTKRTTKKR